MEFTDRNIYATIKDIAEWNELGIYLGFSSDELEVIEKDSRSTSRAIIRLIGKWRRNNEKASWKTLAYALRQMGSKALADSVYCEDSTDPSSPGTITIEIKNTNEASEKLKSSVKAREFAELALSPVNSKRNIEQTIIKFEKQFGFLVRDMRKDILQDEKKIRELPDIITYGLPHRLKGLKDIVKWTPLTKDNFDNFFEILDKMWSFIDYDLLRILIYVFENVELYDRVDAYQEEVEKFCTQTTIHDFIEFWKPKYDIDDIPQELTKCVTKLSLVKTDKVEELKKVQLKLKLFLPQSLAMAAFYICNVQPGSVIVSWLVRAECLLELMDVLEFLLQSDSEFITEIHLSYMSLDNVVLYSSYNDQMLDAILNRDIEVVKELLENKLVDPNHVHHNYEVIPHAPSLTIACSMGNEKIAQQLIIHHAEVNALTDNGGVSPLYIASKNGHAETVRELIDEGAHINLQTSTGESPLYIASYNGHTEIVRELVTRGAQVDLQDNTGASPLFIASQNGHTETVKELIANGAQIDLQENMGATPLYIASYNGFTEIVRELVAKGAQANLKTIEGISPLYIASQNGHTETVKELVTSCAPESKMKRVMKFWPVLFITTLVAALALYNFDHESDNDPVLYGSNSICNEGVWVNFLCEGAWVWILDDSQLNHVSANGDYTINSSDSQSFLNIKCLAKFNCSIIFCFNNITGRQSNNVSFLVQGLLGPVSDLAYLPHNQSLSWEPPFQLNTSQAITYSILVTKVTEDRLIVYRSNHLETYLDLTGKLEQGSTYNVSLWPLNAVGRGQETSMVFTEDPAATSSSVVTDSDGTTSAPPNDPGQRTDTTGAIAGGVAAVVFVAVAVVLTVVIIIIAVIWRRRRREKKHDIMDMSSSSQQQTASWRGFFRRTSPRKDVEKDTVRKRKKI